MKLIVGLGNLGKKYENTRHNMGFLVINRLVGENKWKESRKLSGVFIKRNERVLVKPSTFMNNSGVAVSAFKNFYKVSLDDLYVIHDDLDLNLGEYKIQKGVGPKVHNGVASVERQLGGKEFWRIRIGVDGRNGSRKISGENYVLGRFAMKEKEVVEEVIEQVVQKLRGVLE